MKLAISMKKLKLILIYAFIVFSFIPTFHTNVLRAYFNPEFPPYGTDEKPTEGGLVKNIYLTLTYPLIEYGGKIDIGSFWKMVSPIWKETKWVNWYYEDQQGNWKLVEDLPNLSPEYRAQRSFLNKWIWDFRIARFEGSLIRFPQMRKAYARYLCKQLYDEGKRPNKIMPITARKNIPLPKDYGNWSTAGAPYSRYTKHEVLSC